MQNSVSESYNFLLSPSVLWILRDRKSLQLPMMCIKMKYNPSCRADAGAVPPELVSQCAAWQHSIHMNKKKATPFAVRVRPLHFSFSCDAVSSRAAAGSLHSFRRQAACYIPCLTGETTTQRGHRGEQTTGADHSLNPTPEHHGLWI